MLSRLPKKRILQPKNKHMRQMRKNWRKFSNEKYAECKQNFFLNSVDGICIYFCSSDTELIKKANWTLYFRSCDESCVLCDAKSGKCLKYKGAALKSALISFIIILPRKLWKMRSQDRKICSKDFKSANLKGKCEVCESWFTSRLAPAGANEKKLISFLSWRKKS